MEWLREKWGLLAKHTFVQGAKLCAKYADELIVDSKELGCAWSNKFDRVGKFIPYGAPVLDNMSSNLLVDRGLPTRNYILAVCRVVPENNLDLLFDALPFVKGKVPVIVVGDSNYDHATLKRLRGMSDVGAVIWLGHLSNQKLLDQLWANAGVYWHGHSVGGTNPSLLQALGAGAPTVALDTPFNREVILRDDQLVNRDPVDLSDRINEVLQSVSQRKSMSTYGKRIVAERYSWSAVCSDYHELLLNR
jgi:glycosyltransferase involved in cell wall biosynthesis